MGMIPLKSVKNEADVRTFFRWLLKGNIIFHPDTDFNEYIHLKTGRRTFTKAQARTLNRLMAQAFRAVPDVYFVAIDESRRFES